MADTKAVMFRAASREAMQPRRASKLLAAFGRRRPSSRGKDTSVRETIMMAVIALVAWSATCMGHPLIGLHEVEAQLPMHKHFDKKNKASDFFRTQPAIAQAELSLNTLEKASSAREVQRLFSEKL